MRGGHMPIQIVRNDITKMKVDAIVNAANNSLLGGGGVDGAIHRAAGPELLAECQQLHGCKTGDAKITKGYNLPARYVIHTVGPVWNGGTHGERNLLSSCYRSSLDLAVKYNCQSIAFPLISSGVYGYPKDQALQVAMETVSDFLVNTVPDYDLTVYIVVFSKEATKASQFLSADIQQFIDDHYAERYSDSRETYRHRAMMAREFPNAEDMVCKECAPCAPMAYNVSGSLEDFLKEKDEGFAQALVSMIQKSGKKPSYIYKKANIDKKLFSKIVNNINYHPSKETALAFAIALELNMEETQAFIAKAGYALSHFSKFDIIVEYFILKQHYNVADINIALYDYDQKLLGN